jgi:hypothetical protein
MDCGHDAPRGEDPAVADARFVRGRPSVAGNRFTGKVDDDIRSIDGCGP